MVVPAAVGAWIRTRQTWRLNAAGRRVERESEEEESRDSEGRAEGVELERNTGGTRGDGDGDTQERGTERSRYAV